jgi:DNA-binding HxlR family transcriptional regulator
MEVLMPRKYSMRCSIASTLDVIGDRWTILILRDLFLYPTRRFQDFEASLPGLTPSVLSSRIKELTAHGILTSRLYAEHPPRPEYMLTRKGRALNPVLMAMKAWGEQYATSIMGAASLESDIRN